MAAFIVRALGLVTRPGEAGPAPIPGSKIDRANYILDAAGTFVGKMGGVLQVRPPTGATLRLDSAFNVVNGFDGNSLTSGVQSGTIAGGGKAGFPNSVTDHDGTVSGGVGNRAGDNGGAVDDRQSATVGGGSSNVASGSYSTVGGGIGNVASGLESTSPHWPSTASTRG